MWNWPRMSYQSRYAFNKLIEFKSDMLLLQEMSRKINKQQLTTRINDADIFS